MSIHISPELREDGSRDLESLRFAGIEQEPKPFRKERVMLRPLGNRVLIRPEPAQDRTESGLWIQEDKKPDQSGTVVAVGQPVHPRRDEALKAAERCDWEWGSEDGIGELIRALVVREPVVKVGDFVMFSWQSGQELTVDGERYLLMPEDDLLAVVEGV